MLARAGVAVAALQLKDDLAAFLHHLRRNGQHGTLLPCRDDHGIRAVQAVAGQGNRQVFVACGRHVQLQRIIIAAVDLPVFLGKGNFHAVRQRDGHQQRQHHAQRAKPFFHVQPPLVVDR